MPEIARDLLIDYVNDWPVIGISAAVVVFCIWAIYASWENSRPIAVIATIVGVVALGIAFSGEPLAESQWRALYNSENTTDKFAYYKDNCDPLVHCQRLGAIKCS